MDETPQGSMEISSFTGSGVEEDNTSLSCAAATLAKFNTSALPTTVDISVRSILAIYSFIQVLLGVLLNSMVLFLVYKFKKLRTASFAIAVQIAIMNLTLALIRGLPSVINQITGKWTFGLHLCIAIGFAAFSITTIRTNLIFAFSVDRFTSVFLPFFYPKHSRKIITMLCVLAWSTSVIYHSIGLFPVVDCFAYSEPLLLCSISPACSKNCQSYFYAGVAVLYTPPVIISTVIFISLYIKGRKIRSKESQVSSPDEKVISDQAWRAMKTFMLLLTGVFVVNFVPIVFYNIAENSEKITRSLLYKLTSAIVLTVIITDPIIIMRNADVRGAINVLKNQMKDKFLKSSQGNSGRIN